MSSEKRKRSLTAKGASYKKGGSFKYRGQQKKKQQRQQCRCCGEVMFDVTPTQFIHQHHLLESHKKCFQNGLYHCVLPTCTHYTYHKSDLEKHYRISLQCRSYLEKLESDKNIEAQLTTTSVPIKNIHVQAETLFIGNDPGQISNSVDLFKTNFFRSLSGKSDNELRKMIEEAKQREHSSVEDSQLQTKILIPNERGQVSDRNIFDDVEYEDDSFTAPEANVPDSNNLQPYTHSSSDLLHMKREIEIHKSGSTITPQEEAYIRLESILRRSNVPNHLFATISKWAVDNSEILSVDGTKTMTRESLYKMMAKNVMGPRMQDESMPQQTKILVPSNQEVTLIWFMIKPLIVQLLEDPELNKFENYIFKYKDHPDNVTKDLFFIPPFNSFDDGSYFEDIETGLWYTLTYKKIVTNPASQILVGYGLFHDGTVITNSGSKSLDSVSICLFIYDRQTRNKPEAWKQLAFLPDMLTKTVKTLKLTAQEKAEDYHFVLCKLMQIIRNEIDGKRFEWDFKDSDGNLHRRTLIFSCIFFLGDTKGFDLLCSRYANHNAHGLSRFCTCTLRNSDNPLTECKLLSHDYLQTKSEVELNEASFRKLSNDAFANFKFGACPFGINGATPPDPLHVYLLGICDRLFHAFLDNLTSDMMHSLNSNVARIANFHSRQSGREAFPFLDIFKTGIILPGIVTAKKKLARVFVIYIALATTDFHDFIFGKKGKKPKPKKQKKEKTIVIDLSKVRGNDGNKNPNSCNNDVEDTNDNCASSSDSSSDSYISSDDSSYSEHMEMIDSDDDEDDDSIELVPDEEIVLPIEAITFDSENYTKWFLAFEKTLIFYAWLTSSKMEKHIFKGGRNSMVQKCCRNFLIHLKATINRYEGKGLKLFKFHANLHWHFSICRNGVPLNFDTARCESNHVGTKNKARRTQKRDASFEKQTALRIQEGYILDSNLSRLQIFEDDSKKDHENPILYPKMCGRRFHLTFHYNENDDLSVNATWHRKKRGEKKNWNRNVPFPPEFINAIGKKLKDYNGGDTSRRIKRIAGSCSLKVAIDEKEVTFKANPNEAGSPWFDWALIPWSEEDIEEDDDVPVDSIILPARLCMILDFGQVKYSTVEKYTDVESSKTGIHILVHSAAQDSPRSFHHELKSLLVQKLVMEEELQFVAAKCIKDTAFVVYDSFESTKSIVNIQSMDVWRQSFVESFSDNSIISESIPKMRDAEPNLFPDLQDEVDTSEDEVGTINWSDLL